MCARCDMNENQMPAAAWVLYSPSIHDAMRGSGADVARISYTVVRTAISLVAGTWFLSSAVVEL